MALEDGDLAFLADCHLTHLNLNGCQMLTDGGLASLIRRQPDLEELSLYWILNLGSATLSAIGDRCSGLRLLNLSGCKKVDDASFRPALRALPNLVELDLTRCVNLTDDAYVAVAESCPQLRVLRLYACMRETDASLRAFGAHLHELTVIDLCGAHHITDEGVEALGACHKLSHVNLTWAIQVGDAGVTALAAGCPNLEELSLHGIPGISDAAIEALSRHCQHCLRTLDVRGCSGVVGRDKQALLARLPLLTCFQVHS
eukprot:jgi/Botrbrau1/4614/Bobra.60_2s0098.1